MKTAHVLIPTVITSLALMGCSAAAPDNNAEPAEAIATPTDISHPDDNDVCTVAIERGVHEGEAPDQANITCGEITRIVSGNFSEKTTNRYGPESGVASMNVVNNEARVWLHEDGGTCVVIFKEGDSPTKCIPTGDREEPSPSRESSELPQGEVNSNA